MAVSKVRVVEEFLIATGKRKISLQERHHAHKPWMIVVYIRGRQQGRWVELSTSEYAEEAVARRDFEVRRPNMREVYEEVPMQRGKRIVQDMLRDRLK